SLQTRPARETVVAGHRELCRRQGDGGGNRMGLLQRILVVRGGRALELARLAAELAEVGAIGKLGHDTSLPEPGPACRARTKTACRPGEPADLEVDSVLPADPVAPSAPFA